MKYRGWYSYPMLLYVLLVYAFYPAPHLTVTSQPASLYSYLSEGFLSGHLYLSVDPSPELLSLANPYDPNTNGPYRLHDASLFQGKYYLYFGLLPVVCVYLPFKLLTGFYPSDGLAAFLFLSLAFFVGLRLMVKIKEQYFPKLCGSNLILAGFLIAFAGGQPLLLSLPYIYEVSSASAFCFMMLAFYFLYQAVNKQYRVKDVFLFSLCLSLAAAGRLHFALLCFILIPAFLIHLTYYAPKENWLKLFIVLLLPAMTIAFLQGFYNYQRFGSVINSGHYWQLSCRNIQDLHAELADLKKIPRNLWYSFYYYFLQPFTLSRHFPYLGLQTHNCYYLVDKDYLLEAVGGVLLTTPIILMILVLPKLLIINFKRQMARAPLLWFIVFLAIVPAINAPFLLLLPFAVQRYEADFLPYCVFLAIISLWMLEDYAGGQRWFSWVKLVFVSLSIFSIILGLSFGLVYWQFPP